MHYGHRPTLVDETAIAVPDRLRDVAPVQVLVDPYTAGITAPSVPAHINADLLVAGRETYRRATDGGQ